ncbi:i-AAA protease yme1 [Coemansia sp. BCRC 34301]|nr:i-AAA protease yme1 [Coemansia sp. BCRC 34301]
MSPSTLPPRSTFVSSFLGFLPERSAYLGHVSSNRGRWQHGNKAYLASRLRQFSTQAPVARWGSLSKSSARLSNQNESAPANAPYDYTVQRRLALLKEAADSQMDISEAQNAYYRELLKPSMHGSKAPLVVARIEDGQWAADLATLQLYLSALMQNKSSPERAAMRLVDMLRNQPQLVKQLVGTSGTDGYEKVLQMLAKSNSGFAGIGDWQRDPPNKSSEKKDEQHSDLYYDESAEDYARQQQQQQRDGLNNGTADQPVHVVLQEKSTSAVWTGIKWVLSTLLYAFCILTLVNIVLEGTGVMKATNVSTDFKPEPMTTPVRFTDVQGCEEAKGELEELVQFLKSPQDFTEVGGKLPKGVLLTGPPGTGKTLLARAVAGEAGVPFFFMSGSEFDEVYVGVGASKMRSLFAAARAKAPSIVFIDEIDAIGSKRNARDQTYMKQTLNQLLVNLDGFEQTQGVIFMAATNFPEVLDPALTRPGRFDRVVQVPLPDVRGRAAILKVHSKKIQLASDVDLNIVARGTPGFSGAELQNLLNIAAIEATKQRAKKVSNKHLDFAKDRILMGSERKSAVITPEAKLATAYHEGGHTLAAMYTPGAMPLHKVTIMPRGHALGVTMQLPEADKVSTSKVEYQAMLDVSMGGRAAEELVYGLDGVTSGCSSDLRKATQVANAMVSQFGMNDSVGLVSYTEEEIGRLSAEGRGAIEAEIRQLNQAANERVMKLLSNHREELERLALALVEYETLDKNEIERAVKGLPIERDPVSA